MPCSLPDQPPQTACMQLPSLPCRSSAVQAALHCVAEAAGQGSKPGDLPTFHRRRPTAASDSNNVGDEPCNCVQRVGAGELVLMDAGCELHGYASDVTRTWPVSGAFSKHQRALYEVVLDAHRCGACLLTSILLLKRLLPFLQRKRGFSEPAQSFLLLRALLKGRAVQPAATAGCLL